MCTIIATLLFCALCATVENPCDSGICNSSSMCLLSPTSPDGYTCVCADDVTDCIGEISEISYLEVFIFVTRTA